MLVKKMKVMKQIITMFSAVLLMVSMTACSNGNGNREIEANQNQKSGSIEHRQQDTSILIAHTPEGEFEECIGALEEAGVSVESHVLEGMPHGFSVEGGWINGSLLIRQ